jgi:hypothetical protein
MRTPQPLADGAAERFVAMRKEANRKADYQRIPCVWLRAALGFRAAGHCLRLAGRLGRAGTFRLSASGRGRAAEQTLGRSSSPEPDH